MASAERALGAIGAYIARLEPDLFGPSRTRRRIAEEIRGHLEDAVANGMQRGLSLEAAQEDAIARFGSPQVVINSWAQSKGIGVVTNFTRFGGLAGIFGSLGLTAAMVYADISWSFSIGWFAEVALTFGAFLAFGMIALYMRLRGKLGRYSRIGFRLIFAGLIVGFGSSAMWFAPGGIVGVALLVVGLSLYFVGALRARVVPRVPLLLWVAGLALTVPIGLIGTVGGFDSSYVAGGVGYLSFDIGWLGLGLHLWSERPAIRDTHSPMTA